MAEFLTSNEVWFQVDDEDESLVLGYSWNADKDGYIRRRGGKTIKLHNLILPPKPGVTVDHIDNDPANNHRCNLRYATPSEQRLNNTSKGITLTHLGWWARVQFKGIRYDLGYFKTEEEAIEARNKKREGMW